MRSSNTRLLRIVGALCTVLVIFVMANSSFAKTAKTDKMKTEEILAKHLESIGTKEARDAVKSIVIYGAAKALIRGRNAGETSGEVVIASEGKKNLIGMRFPNNEYPYEKMGYDGDEFTVGFIQPGRRSNFGEFLLSNRETFKIGIMGGTLSTSWELLNYNEKVGRLKCKGTEKIDGIKHHECKYEPKKSNLKIKFYFHPETFRLVRTQYKRVISGGQGIGIDNSSRQNETRFTLTEDFSNFKEANKLTLPIDYKITYELQTGNGTSIMEWNMALAKFTINQAIDPAQFKVDVF